jgi:hypothetical protein
MSHTETQIPFFARFLESQKRKDQEAALQQAGQRSEFGPTNPFADSPFTEKWPSDMEDA